jgi:hypothetical protein
VVPNDRALYHSNVHCGIRWVAEMERSLIWIEGDANGWACSNCGWKFPRPNTAYCRGSEGCLRPPSRCEVCEHKCEAEPSVSATKREIKRNADTTFEERVRVLIKRGYRPKVAVELVLQEVEITHGNDPRFMERARADAEDFFLRVRKGLI